MSGIAAGPYLNVACSLCQGSRTGPEGGVGRHLAMRLEKLHIMSLLFLDI